MIGGDISLASIPDQLVTGWTQFAQPALKTASQVCTLVHTIDEEEEERFAKQAALVKQILQVGILFDIYSFGTFSFETLQNCCAIDPSLGGEHPATTSSFERVTSAIGISLKVLSVANGVFKYVAGQPIPGAAPLLPILGTAMTLVGIYKKVKELSDTDKKVEGLKKILYISQITVSAVGLAATVVAVIGTGGAVLPVALATVSTAGKFANSLFENLVVNQTPIPQAV